MNDLIDWLIQLPKYFSEFGSWLVTPLPFINASPLAMFGVSAVAVITIVIGLKIKNLVV